MRMPGWFTDAESAIEDWVADQFICPVMVLWDDIYSLQNAFTGNVETVIPVFTLDGDNERHEAMYPGTIYELLRNEALIQAKDRNRERS
jgi:hypothetical protein